VSLSHATRRALLMLGLFTGACGDVDGGGWDRCEDARRTGTLPSEIDEASGLAASLAHPGVLWTHNDSGGEAVVFAVDTAGRILGRVRVDGARNRDWEDIALGPCPAGTCLYIADTGDNNLNRQVSTVYRISEPSPADSVSSPAERLPVRLPDGPRDIEALTVLPSGDLIFVDKGREHPISVYRYPAPVQPDDTVRLERIQSLGTAAAPLPYQVTGAAATPDGRWVVIRTYTAVEFRRVQENGRLSDPVRTVDVQELAEPQGEGVEILSDGTVLLISEAGPAGVPGTIGVLRCNLD